MELTKTIHYLYLKNCKTSKQIKKVKNLIPKKNLVLFETIIKP